jgi:protein SCO1/2
MSPLRLYASLGAAVLLLPSASRADPPHCHGEHRPVAAAPLPGASIYQLDAAWTTQDGATVRLASLRGSAVLVLMFFGSCRSACPVLLTDIARLDAALPPPVRTQTRVLLVTFDPENDTPARLRALATTRGLDTTRWTLLAGRTGDVRALATLLGVQYTRTGNAMFDHSNVITLLDRDGVPRARVEGLSAPNAALIQATTQATR